MLHFFYFYVFALVVHPFFSYALACAVLTHFIYSLREYESDHNILIKITIISSSELKGSTALELFDGWSIPPASLWLFGPGFCQGCKLSHFVDHTYTYIICPASYI